MRTGNLHLQKIGMVNRKKKDIFDCFINKDIIVEMGHSHVRNTRIKK